MGDRTPEGALDVIAYTSPAIRVGAQAMEVLAFSTPDRWNDELRRLLASIRDEIDDYRDQLRRLVDTIDEDTLITWGLLAPVPLVARAAMIGWSLQVKAAKQLLSMRVDGWHGDRIEEFTALADAVDGAVRDLFGSPADLMALAGHYRAAARLMGDASDGVTARVSAMEDFWRVYDDDGTSALAAYRRTAAAQSTAMDGTEQMLLTASGYLAGAARSLTQVWSDIVQALISLASAVLDQTAEALDLGRVLLGSVGEPFSLLSIALEFVNTATASIRRAVAESQTTGTEAWAALMLEAPGLTSGRWPALTAHNGGRLQDPEEWSRW